MHFLKYGLIFKKNGSLRFGLDLESIIGAGVVQVMSQCSHKRITNFLLGVHFPEVGVQFC